MSNSKLARVLNILSEHGLASGIRIAGLRALNKFLISRKAVESGEKPFLAIDWHRITKSHIENAAYQAQTLTPDIAILTDTQHRVSNFQTIPVDSGIMPPSNVLLLYACENVDRSLPILRQHIQNGGKFIPVEQFGPTRFLDESAVAKASLLESLEVQIGEGCLKFDVRDFNNLLQFIESTKGTPGHYAEVCCFRGSSGDAALRYMRNRGISRNCIFVDVLDGFNYDAALDSPDKAWLNTHATEGAPVIESRLKRLESDKLSVDVRKADICRKESFHDISEIFMANIDVDIYEAVRDAMDYIWPKIVTGGIMVIKDGGHTPYLIVARLAIEEFKEKTTGRHHHVIMESGQHCFFKL